MKTAIIKTNLWDDDSFFEMGLDSKLVLFYLLSHPGRGIAPIYKFSARMAVASLGLTVEQIQYAMKQLASANMIEYHKGYVYLGKSTYIVPKKGRFTESSLRKEISEIPIDILDYFKIEHPNFELIANIKKYRQETKTKEFLDKVYAKYTKECAVCGTTEDLTIDHILALSKGGTNDLDNIQILCVSHNSSKGIDTEEYLNDNSVVPEYNNNNKDNNSNKVITKNTNKVVKYTPKDVELTNLLHTLMQENSPNRPVRTPKDSDYEDINKMFRLDKIPYDGIEMVIKWCQQDSFWQSNIRSTGTLRRQYDKLEMQARRFYNDNQRNRTVEL